ncbi:MAG: polysaccharide biosynthesis protein [Oscillospiraceae bacterium]|nr:polysaccharide biosynthesis protein [Oscillospiraceae bacterium]
MSGNQNKILTEMQRRKLLIAAADVLSVFGSFYAGLWLVVDLHISATLPYGWDLLRFSLAWSFLTLGVFSLCKLYHSVWTFAGVDELFQILVAEGILAAVGFCYLLFFDQPLPTSVYVMGGVFNSICTVSIRFSYRMLRSLRNYLRHFDRRTGDRVMIIGAGEAGRTLLTEFEASDYMNSRVVCFIDDNPNKLDKRLGGVPIVGGRKEIPQAVVRHQITRIIFAIPSATPAARKEILNICAGTGCKVQVLPGIYQLVSGEVSVSKLRKVDPQDLLGRDPVRVDMEEIFRSISGKVVLVTGGGGSIGSELCRQIAGAEPKKLVIFDIYENNAYDIQMELRRTHPKLDLVVLIGSVRNENRVEAVLREYKPELVFHAAAHKHVPLMEDSPNEAIKNNVFGTYNMARAAAKHGVRRFVLISTDKAVNPTNIMGASKRLCEMVVQMMDRQTDTEFVAVRFGNVLGSNGSVIPLFKKQIEAGGPVTVTHPDIIRYFMTIPEAVSLVLQAGCYARGGEIFVLDMGEPVRIDDMARNLIRLSGYEPDVDIRVEYTGLRPGEKLYEELLMMEEGLRETANQRIHIGCPIEMDDGEFLRQLRELEAACQREDPHIKELVARIVSTYRIKTAV